MVKKCPKCGKTRMVPGHVTAVGFRFVPARGKLFYARPVGVAAVACYDCGYLETYVSRKQLAAAVAEVPTPVEEPGATEILANAQEEGGSGGDGDAPASPASPALEKTQGADDDGDRGPAG